MPQLILEDDDGVIAMLRDSIASFVEGRPGPQATRALRARSGDMDLDLWREMAQNGWLGILLPEELGGAGLSIRHQAAISEALGRALVPSPLATASVLSAALLSGAEPSDDVRRLAEGLVSGSSVVAPALVSSARAAPTARAEADGLVLDGRVEFVEAAASATDFIVEAKLNGAAVLASVPADSAGLQRIDRPGVDGTLVSTLILSGVPVPAARVLARGAHAEAVIARAVDIARIALSAELSGNASAAFEQASAYTQQRVQFGKPIASFQVIQHRLVDLWGEAEFAASAVVNAIERQDEGNEKAARLAVLAAKARASEAAFLIGRRALHLYGAMGFTDECDIGLYLKRAINLGAMLGQAEELRLQFVREERAA
jgi:alkylation response protein AidB-like acyl-CoA dehydrogenase